LVLPYTLTGSLLRTITSTKHKGKILELGTGAGVSTSWIIDGMDSESILTTVEKEENLQAIAQKYLGYDSRIEFLTMDSGEYIEKNKTKSFDFIFADTWPGKFYLLDEVLNMLNQGGIYLIDDLSLVSTWPEDHKNKVKNLICYLESKDDFFVY
jgi:predicted O-methyltransferase YrrM